MRRISCQNREMYNINVSGLEGWSVYSSVRLCFELDAWRHKNIRKWENSKVQAGSKTDFFNPFTQITNFIFCWQCIMLWFMVNDQRDAQFFSMYLFQFSTCFEKPRAHHQENQLYQLFRVQVGKEIFPFRPAHETVTDTDWHIPEVVLMQLILLMMSTRMLETCREFK